MRIGTCQTPDILADADAALRVVEDFAGRADTAGVDLLLFPECFLQGYLVTADHLHAQALEIGSAAFQSVLARMASIRPMLVLGMIEEDGGRYFNTAVVIVGGRVV